MEKAEKPEEKIEAKKYIKPLRHKTLKIWNITSGNFNWQCTFGYDHQQGLYKTLNNCKYQSGLETLKGTSQGHE